MTLDYSGELDPNKPYESMARRLIDNVQNGPSIRRIRAAIANAKALNADGVILFCHWGCKQTMGMALLARRMLSDARSADARSGRRRLRQPQRRGRSDGHAHQRIP